MKKMLLIGVVLFMWTGLACAEPISCEQVEKLAGTIMKARQNGTPMSRLIKKADSEGIKQLIVMAYEQPRFASEKYQKRAIEKFKNKVYLECYKSRNK